MQMLIPGNEIQPFIHYQEDGSGVALGPYPSDCHLNKNSKGIVLCFLFYTMPNAINRSALLKLCVSSNGNRFIIPWRTYRMYRGYHLYILCLSNDYFREEFHRDTRFKLQISPEDVRHEYEPEFDPEDNFYAPYYFAKILSAGCVRIEDIEDLNKSEIERQRREGQGVFDLNKINEMMDFIE
ncbi:hypothetical protein PIB30_043896 [Stylosanthes scabra]|uniref:Uncharacterized protein n=1 Tax=Stylosanthes scabra TaxID=79078 RepID=A0ABU6TFC3_9FABA|nr:hypothetical protein [Stylosanthes scabra]